MATLTISHYEILEKLVGWASCTAPAIPNWIGSDLMLVENFR